MDKFVPKEIQDYWKIQDQSKRPPCGDSNICKDKTNNAKERANRARIYNKMLAKALKQTENAKNYQKIE